MKKTHEIYKSDLKTRKAILNSQKQEKTNDCLYCQRTNNTGREEKKDNVEKR